MACYDFSYLKKVNKKRCLDLQLCICLLSFVAKLNRDICTHLSSIPLLPVSVKFIAIWLSPLPLETETNKQTNVPVNIISNRCFLKHKASPQSTSFLTGQYHLIHSGTPGWHTQLCIQHLPLDLQYRSPKQPVFKPALWYSTQNLFFLQPSPSEYEELHPASCSGQTPASFLIPLSLPTHQQGC